MKSKKENKEKDKTRVCLGSVFVLITAFFSLVWFCVIKQDSPGPKIYVIIPSVLLVLILDVSLIYLIFSLACLFQKET